MKLVTYATPDPFYQMCAVIWEAHCDHAGIRHELHLVTGTTWTKNCCYKPDFLYDRTWGESPFAWCDVDCLVMRMGEFPPVDEWDVAVKRGTRLPITAGWIGFSGSERSRAFLGAWSELLSQQGSPKGDHDALLKIYADPPAGVRILDASDLVEWRVNAVKAFAKSLPGTAKCPHCGEGYWGGFYGVTIAGCKQCGKTVFADQWKK